MSGILLPQFFRNTLPTRIIPPVDPFTGTFAEEVEQNRLIGMLWSKWHFDQQNNVGGPADGSEVGLLYNYDGADPALVAAMTGFTNHNISGSRAVGEGNTKIYNNAGGIHRIQVDNDVFHEAGGGFGSLKFVRKDPGGQGSGGYFLMNMNGRIGVNEWIGVDHENHGAFWLRLVRQTENMEANWGFPTVGAHKIILIFFDPPGGANSGEGELASICVESKEMLFQMYGNQGHDPFERTIASQFLLQDAAICPYVSVPAGSFDLNNNRFGSPCVRLNDGPWHEILIEGRFRPAHYDFYLDGNVLQTWSPIPGVTDGPALFESWMVDKDIFLTRNGGNTHKGFARIASITDSKHAVLADMDASLSGATGPHWSGLSGYISYYPNSYIQAWINGVRVMRWPFFRGWWRRPSITANWGRGWGQFQLQDHATNRHLVVGSDNPDATIRYDDVIVNKAPLKRANVTNPIKTIGASMAVGTVVNIVGMENFNPGPDGPDLLTGDAIAGQNVFGQKGTGQPKTYFEFTKGGFFDGIGERILKLGATDGAPASSQNRFLSLTLSAHSWSYLGLPKLPPALDATFFLGHDYRHSAFDAANLIWYRRFYNSGWVVRMNLVTGEQTYLPELPGFTTSVTAIFWHPNRGTAGRLVMYSGQDNILIEWDPISNAWTTIQSGGFTTMGTYHNWALHCPKNNMGYFGGGNHGVAPFNTDSKKVFALPPTGGPIALTNCPVDVGEHPDWALPTLCPASGDLIAIHATGGKHKFNIGNGAGSAWSEFTIPSPNIFEKGSGTIVNTVAAPIHSPAYGNVIMFMKYYRGDDRSWVELYKHAA